MRLPSLHTILTRVCCYCLVTTAAAAVFSYAQDSTLYEDWRWALFTTENGLPSNRVYDIIETSDGIPWAVTNNGIAWYNGFKWIPAIVKPVILTKRPSRMIPDRNGNLLVVADGDLYVGDQNGFQRQRVTLEGHDLAIDDTAHDDGDRYLLRADDSVYSYSRETGALHPIALPAAFGDGYYPFLKSPRGTWINTSRPGAAPVKSACWRSNRGGDARESQPD